MRRFGTSLLVALLLACAPAHAQSAHKSCPDLFRDIAPTPTERIAQITPLADSKVSLGAAVVRRAGYTPTFMVVPSNEAEMRNIFESRDVLTVGLENEYLRARQKAQERLRNLSFVPATDSLTSLRAAIENAQSTFVNIVGHNEQGRLKLPDGSSIALADLGRIATRSGRILVALSCRSQEVLSLDAIGVERDLTYLEAIELARAVADEVEELLTRQDLELGVLRSMLQAKVDGKRLNTTERVHVELVTEPTVDGVVLLAVSVRVCFLDDDNTCH